MSVAAQNHPSIFLEIEEDYIWTRTDVVIMSQLKANTVEVVMGEWPGAQLEYIPARRKDLVSAPRAGLAMLIHPDIAYYVGHVYNVRSTKSNGIIQAIKVALHGGKAHGDVRIPDGHG